MSPQNQPNTDNSTGVEISHDIPVQAPSNLQTGSAALPQTNNKIQMDKLLQQVSSDVKKSDKQSKRPPKLRKIKQPKQLSGNKASLAKFLPIIVAVTVFVILSAAAIYAYSHNQKPVVRVNTSKTFANSNIANKAPAVQTITQADLSSFASDLQNQINDLGLTQYSTAELSDSSLGL